MPRLDQRRRGPRRRTSGARLGLGLYRQLLATVDLWTPRRWSDCGSEEERGLRQLIRGHFDFASDLTLAELEALWQGIGEDLIRAHAEHRPGTRPWAWWKWAVREDLRPREGARHLPAVRGGAWGHPDGYQDLETEATYLDRLGLLLPGEAEALAALPGSDGTGC